MNWGHRFKELITRNWREKLISLLLAFLFWFMIKAQGRPPHAALLQPAPRAGGACRPALTPAVSCVRTRLLCLKSANSSAPTAFVPWPTVIP